MLNETSRIEPSLSNTLIVNNIDVFSGANTSRGPFHFLLSADRHQWVWPIASAAVWQNVSAPCSNWNNPGVLLMIAVTEEFDNVGEPGCASARLLRSMNWTIWLPIANQAVV